MDNTLLINLRVEIHNSMELSSRGEMIALSDEM